jgi:hypothetical protein
LIKSALRLFLFLYNQASQLPDFLFRFRKIAGVLGAWISHYLLGMVPRLSLTRKSRHSAQALNGKDNEAS